MSEVRQRTGDAIIAPTGVFPCHLNDEGRHFLANRRPAGIPTMLRAVELLSNQLSEPAQDGLGPGNGRNFLQTLSTEPSADLSKRGTLIVRKPKPIWQVCPEDLVLRRKIFNL